MTPHLQRSILGILASGCAATATPVALPVCYPPAAVPVLPASSCTCVTCQQLRTCTSIASGRALSMVTVRALDTLLLERDARNCADKSSTARIPPASMLNTPICKQPRCPCSRKHRMWRMRVRVCHTKRCEHMEFGA